MSTTTIRLPAEWKAPLLQLRDNLPEAQAQELIATLATRTPEQITALLQAVHQPVTPEAPAATSDAGIPASALRVHQPVTPEAPAATVAKIRTDSNAVLPRRRPSEPKPLDPGKIAIIVRNEAMMAVHLGGKRYIVDTRIQVTPQELEVMEADLGQRKQWWGNTTRIERLEPA